MRLFVLGALLLMLAGAATAATIVGTAYSQDLQVAKYSLLLINTTPSQRVLLVDGTYNITVPKGTYAMHTYINVDGRMYDDELNVTVADEGTYSYDFILFPAEGNITETIPEVDEDLVFSDAGPEQGLGSGKIVLGILVILALISVIVALSKRRAQRQPPAKEAHQDPGTPAPKAARQEPIAADLQSALAFIREQGGRTTQKELRKQIPCSEAKLSMMLTELEAKGKIQKIKKGRGNLIILK